MKFEIDLHTHTILSSHAYSTIIENAKYAKLNGNKVFAITDHGPKLPGGAHPYSFNNLKIIPEIIDDIRILTGAETNICGINGELDLCEKSLSNLDIILGAFHRDAVDFENTFENNTNILIKAIRNKHIDIIAHPGNPMFLFDYEKVLKVAKEYMVAIEFNNSSFLKSRPGSKPNCLKILKFAKKIGNYISVGSDSHFAFEIGILSKIEKILSEINYNKELILNENKNILQTFLNENKNTMRKNKIII